MFESGKENLALAPNRSAHYAKLPSQIIILGLVLSETNGKLVHLIHEQRAACLLNSAGRDSQRFTEFFFFPIGTPGPLIIRADIV